jgi:hypothetical protein
MNCNSETCQANLTGATIDVLYCDCKEYMLLPDNLKSTYSEHKNAMC